MPIDRRGFIRITGVSIACACAGGIGAAGCTAERMSQVPFAPIGSYRVEPGQIIVSVSAIDTLAEIGGAVKLAPRLEDGSQLAIILVHPAEGDYRAFDDHCTHNGKELDYLHQEEELVCISRGSRFDLAGDVIRGSAKDALIRYPLRREGEELVLELRHR